MSEIEAHSTILTDPKVSARPATEPEKTSGAEKPAMTDADANGNDNGEDEIRGRPGVAPVKAE